MGLDPKDWKISELEREVKYLQSAVSQLTTGMRNARTELEDGDVDEAIATLNQFIKE